MKTSTGCIASNEGKHDASVCEARLVCARICPAHLERGRRETGTMAVTRLLSHSSPRPVGGAPKDARQKRTRGSEGQGLKRDYK